MKRLAPLSLKTANGDTVTTDWRKHTTTVLVFLHDAHCFACRRVFQQYEALRSTFSEWDTALELIWRGDKIPDDLGGVREESVRTRSACLDGDSAGVVVVDRHGVVVRQWGASVGRGFPKPEEVLQSVKQACLECPE